jgi:hypothetical protein
MDAIIKRWRGGNHGGISINRNMILDTLLFAEDQVLIASSEDELQQVIYNLQKMVSLTFLNSSRSIKILNLKFI